MSDEPTNHADLMSRIDTEWSTVQSAIATLSEAQLNQPDEGGWSIKDNLAHLAAWERALLYVHMQNQPETEVWGLDAETLKNMETINTALQKRSAAQTAAQVLADSRETHAKLLDTLNGMSFDQVMRPRYPNEPERGALLGWVIGDTYEHYAEHGANILKMVKHLAG